ncbi:hypothetical protein BVC80_1261g9 [Macleaya cordata]|uniref:Uncharacterized protein n=1 Tax=Macleaya cordata TaxID=56857 RepID=A0A200PV68_MACCD|nr:hypothetical protein BVC80_1261g9 [Macleaya cordata]
MAGGEAGSKVVRLVAFLGAGVICTSAINLWRDFERKKVTQQTAAEIAEKQQLGSMVKKAVE